MNPYAAGAGDDRRYSLLPNSSTIAHSAAPLHVSHSSGFTGNLSTVPPSPSLYALESSRKLEEEVRRELDPLRARAMAERLREVQLLGLLPLTANGIPWRPPAPEPTLLIAHGSYYSSPYPTSHRNDTEDRVAGPSPTNSVSDPDSDDVEEEYPPRGGRSELRPSRRVQEKMEKIKKMFGQEALAAPLEEKEAPAPAGGHCYRCGRDGHVLTSCDLSNQDILGYKKTTSKKRKIQKRKFKKWKSRWEKVVQGAREKD